LLAEDEGLGLTLTWLWDGEDAQRKRWANQGCKEKLRSGRLKQPMDALDEFPSTIRFRNHSIYTHV
jgi:hypothetical protein